MTPNHFKLFMGWENDQLSSLAVALDSAQGEGAGDLDLADALCEAAEHRGIRLPLAYGHGELDPEAWRNQINQR